MHTPPDFDACDVDCARIINVRCDSTVDGVLEDSVQVRAQAVAMATKHPDVSFVCKKIPIWMHTPPDIDACDDVLHRLCYDM